MTPQARAIWDALEFRMPAVLAKVADLSDADLSWQPPTGANSIAWLLCTAERGLKTEEDGRLASGGHRAARCARARA